MTVRRFLKYFVTDSEIAVYQIPVEAENNNFAYVHCKTGTITDLLKSKEQFLNYGVFKVRMTGDKNIMVFCKANKEQRKKLLLERVFNGRFKNVK